MDARRRKFIKQESWGFRGRSQRSQRQFEDREALDEFAGLPGNPFLKEMLETTQDPIVAQAHTMRLAAEEAEARQTAGSVTPLYSLTFWKEWTERRAAQAERQAKRRARKKRPRKKQQEEQEEKGQQTGQAATPGRDGENSTRTESDEEIAEQAHAEERPLGLVTEAAPKPQDRDVGEAEENGAENARNREQTPSRRSGSAGRPRSRASAATLQRESEETDGSPYFVDAARPDINYCSNKGGGTLRSIRLGSGVLPKTENRLEKNVNSVRDLLIQRSGSAPNEAALQFPLAQWKTSGGQFSTSKRELLPTHSETRSCPLSSPKTRPRRLIGGSQGRAARFEEPDPSAPGPGQYDVDRGMTRRAHQAAARPGGGFSTTERLQPTVEEKEKYATPAPGEYEEKTDLTELREKRTEAKALLNSEAGRLKHQLGSIPGVKFGFGCSLEEHRIYGQCLDGQCGKRAPWEDLAIDREDMGRLGGKCSGFYNRIVHMESKVKRKEAKKRRAFRRRVRQKELVMKRLGQLQDMKGRAVEEDEQQETKAQEGGSGTAGGQAQPNPSPYAKPVEERVLPMGKRNRFGQPVEDETDGAFGARRPFPGDFRAVLQRRAEAAAKAAALDDAVAEEEETDEPFSPLLVAASRGDVDVVHHLCLAGWDIDVRDEMDRTPLAIAVEREYIDVVFRLLKNEQFPLVEGSHGFSQPRKKPDVDPVDEHGMTPLMVASEKGNMVLVEALCDAGADAMRRTPRGLLISEAAASHKIYQVLRMRMEQQRLQQELAETQKRKQLALQKTGLYSSPNLSMSAKA